MRELWINNELIDLYPNGNIALTKQCNKLNELKDRQADYSNQFTIPPTPNNKRICGFPNIIGSYSINPYTKISATYIEDGSELISNGIAIIEQYNGNISVTLYSGIYDFFNTIGDKSLRDLDLSAADHIFNLTNVEAGNTSDYYVYPLIQWGETDKDNDIVDIRYQMPALRVPFIMDKIFETAGYQKEGGVFNLASYNALILPVVEDSLIDTDAVLLANSFIAHTELAYTLASGSDIINRINLSYYGSGDAFSSELYGSSVRHDNTGKYASSVGYRYIAINQVNGNIDIGLYVRYSTRFFLWAAKNGQWSFPGDGSVSSLGYTEFIGTSGGGIAYVELHLTNIRLNPGDYIEFLSTSQLKEIYPTGDLMGNPLDYSYVSFTATNTIELGQNIYFNNLVPNIKQKDLIKDLMIAYCLVPQYDPLTRTISFIQFDTIGDIANQFKSFSYRGLVDGKSFFTDWSDKIDIKSEPNVKFRFDGYAQTNFMKWAQDDDREETGTGSISIDDNTLTLTTDLFSTVLAASIQEKNFKGSNTGVNIKRYTRVEADQYSSLTDYSSGDYALFNGIVYETSEDVTGTAPPSSPWTALEIQYLQTESAAPRLLLVRDYDDGGSPAVSSLTYTDGTSNLVIDNAKIAYFVDPLQAYDLSFQFIIGEHYQTLVGVLNKTKIVIASFKLTDNDFKNIDFFKPIYIEYFGNYFYLNEATNYISGRLTDCEIVRL
jgi:hypothetical protein